MNYKKIILGSAAAVLCVTNINAYRHLYFSAPYPFGTRFERKGLVTIQGWAVHGTTTEGKDGNAKTTNILNMHGLHKMHQVGKNLSGFDITKPRDLTLDTLWRVTPTTDDFAKLEFSGKCSFSGGQAQIEYNLSDEFFVGATVPYYKLDIQNPVYVDKTPSDLSAAEDSAWQAFKAAFDDILTDWGIKREAVKKSGIGDITTYVGWTRNADDLDQLDFLDATLKVGATLGTADAKDEDQAFSFAPGYDKHNGMFLTFDMAFGTNDFATFGFHLSQMFLFKKKKNMRMQSSAGQNGFIKLGKGNATRDMGNIYEVGGFLKGEVNVASLYGAYTYAHKGDDSLTTDNADLFPTAVVNSDEMLKGWSTHTVTVGAELDFTNEERRVHPKLGIFYSRVIRARRAFLNHTVGGNLGVSISCSF